MPTNIIAVCSHKGGSGKTTMAVNWALAAQARGVRVAVVDMDTQQLSAKLISSNRRQHNADLIPLSVTPSGPRELVGVLRRLRLRGVELVFIDGRPGHEDQTAAAAIVSDAVVLTIQPSPLDLAAVGGSIATIKSKRVNVPIGLLQTRCEARSTMADLGRRAAGVYELTTSPVDIKNRVIYLRAAAIGLGVTEYDHRSKAASEVERTLDWVLALAGSTHGEITKQTRQTRQAVGA